MKKLNRESEWFRVLVILMITIVIGGIFFIMNSMTGILNIILFLIQTFLGLFFGLWYFRIFLAYVKEIRKKNPEKKVGIPKGWAIFGIISTLINVSVWGFTSALIFNIPKIFYLVPFALALIQIIYTLHKANRRKLRDWLLLVYNVVAFIYVLNWTLIDFGVDMPSVLGVFSHTVTSSVMWWQLIFVNTGAYFSPTFMFPPYMLNPRYYFAVPIDEYYKAKEDEYGESVIKTSGGDPSGSSDEKKDIHLIGERQPFFEERRREREDKAEIAAIRKKLSKRHYDQDTKYAEFVGSNDFSFNFRGLVTGFDNLLRNICLSIIIVLILVTPMVFAGNVSMNVLPNYQKQNYGLKPGMVMAIKGNVFTTYDFTGNVTSAWDEDLDDEIALLKELHATHVRYDILSSALENTKTLTILNQGLQRIKDEGIALILGVAGDFVFSRKELIETIYRDAKIIAANYQPDYMIVYDELNGGLAEFVTETTTIYDWIPEIINVTNEIKISSPTTKVVTTVVGFKDGYDIFSELLTNSSLNIDVVGVNFDPILFGWRLNTLLEYGSIYQNVTTTRKFWLSEIGMESFNFGEDAQAKFLANIISKVSLTEELNADGLCITSLIDNIGITVDRGISSHLGLVYFNGRKKKSFDAVSYGFGTVLGVL